MKKKLKVISLCLLIVVVLGCGIFYTIYHKASDYILQETIGKGLETSFTEATGVDLSQPGRVLEAEEVAKVESILQAAQSVAAALENNETQAGTKDESTQTTPTHSEDNVKLPSDKPITTDEVKQTLEQQVTQVIKKIPTKEKNDMMSLVVSKLSMSDISDLASLAGDGISSQDISKAKSIALKNYSEEELEQLKAYYEKYSYLIP